jgi:two-component system, LuxR family, response regulator FixJ
MTHEPTVFVVDDDQAVCGFLRELIGMSGQSVETFSSAEEFLISDKVEKPGCLLLDIRMPGMSGLDLQKELRARAIRLPIIFLSAHGDIAMAVQAVKDGAHDFIEKPFSNKHLLACIQSALATISFSDEAKYDPNEINIRLGTLTPRERQILELVVAEESNKGIAERLNISERTVEVHRSNMMRKMGAGSPTSLLKMTLIAKTQF